MDIMTDDTSAPLIRPAAATPLEPGKRGYFRFAISLLLSFGFLMDYILRINMSFALEKIVPENCTNNSSYYCWNQELQGYVLSSFLWGYWITQLPGALISGTFGAAKIFGTGLSIAIVATALCPVFAQINPWLLISLRTFIGLGQGVTFPVALNIITNWAPVSEKGIFTALSTGGQYLGAVLANTISGILCSSNVLGGWPSVFYIFSMVGALWMLLWFLLVSDSPLTSRWVGADEKQHLTETTDPVTPVPFKEIPWRKILTNRAFISTVVIHTANGYGYYILLLDMPKFMVEVLDYDIKSSGFIASVPYLAIWLGYITSGYFGDRLISSGILSVVNTRKLIGFIALFPPAVLLWSLTYVHDRVYVVILMNIAMYFNGYANSCYFVNYMDLSPKFCAVLCGIGNGLCAVSGFIGPLFVGWLLNDVDKDDHVKLHKQWQIVFITASVVWVIGAVQFCVFGSGEKQEFDLVHVEDGSSESDGYGGNVEPKFNTI